MVDPDVQRLACKEAIMTFVDIFRKLAPKQKESAPVKLLMGMEGMRERNEARIAKIKAEMGEKYILHPSHMKSRLNEPRPV